MKKLNLFTNLAFILGIVFNSLSMINYRDYEIDLPQQVQFTFKDGQDVNMTFEDIKKLDSEFIKGYLCVNSQYEQQPIEGFEKAILEKIIYIVQNYVSLSNNTIIVDHDTLQKYLHSQTWVDISQIYQALHYLQAHSLMHEAFEAMIPRSEFLLHFGSDLANNYEFLQECNPVSEFYKRVQAKLDGKLLSHLTKKCPQTFKNKYMDSFVGLPDGKLAIKLFKLSSYKFIPGIKSFTTIKIWDIKKEKNNKSIYESTREAGSNDRNTREINSFDLSTDGKLAIGSYEVVKILDVETKELLSTFSEDYYDVRKLAWSPDNTKLAVGLSPAKVELWDLQNTGVSLHVFDENENGGEIELLAWSPDGSKLASRSNHMMKIWDVETGICLQTLGDRDRGGPTTMAWSPDGNKLATIEAGDHKLVTIKGGDTVEKMEHILKIWNVDTGICLKELTVESSCGHCHIAWTPSVNLAIGSCDGEVTIVDPETGNCLHTFCDGNLIFQLTWLSGGKLTILTKRSHKMVNIWDLGDRNLSIMQKLLVLKVLEAPRSINKEQIASLSPLYAQPEEVILEEVTTSLVQNGEVSNRDCARCSVQ